MRCACVGRLGLEIQLHTDTLWLSSLLSSSSTDVWCQARPPATLAPVLLGLTLPGVINILTHVERVALGRTPVGKVRLSARVIRDVLFAVVDQRLNIQTHPSRPSLGPFLPSKA